MRRKREYIDSYTGPALQLGSGPFNVEDRQVFESIAKIAVSDERFEELVGAINSECRRWQQLRRLEVEPTLSQRSKWYLTLARKSAELATLLEEPETEEHPAPVSEPEQRFPAVVPFDEDYVKRMKSQDGALEHLREDPTTHADGNLPWRLDRLRDAFDRHYFGEPPEPRQFEFGNEALLEIAPVLRALAAAAHEEVALALRENIPQTSEKGGEPAANEQLFGSLVPSDKALFGEPLPRSLNPAPDDLGEPTGQSMTTGPAITANRQLFERLVPIYKELFGQEKIARSINPTPEADGTVLATGPAVRFYRFVSDRLGIDDAPADNTIGTWIFKLQDKKKLR